MDTLPNIKINTAAAIRIERITDEIDCVIVDDFLMNPGEIVDFACSHAAEFSIPDLSYPGLLRDVDAGAMADVYRFIRSKMNTHFSFMKGGMRLATYLSMATMQPDKLTNLQRLCHADPRERLDRRNYAALVYLFKDEDLGGTGFYRWKERELVEQATAIELNDPVKGLAFLQDHFPSYREPACYMTESNEIAELLCEILARYNRLIFYSGDVPHSASISSPELLSNDFSTGRLTLNCFASVRPR